VIQLRRQTLYLHKLAPWVISGGLLWAIAAPVAQAESHQVNLLLNTQPNETFETLMRQAETIARQSVEQHFADPATTEVSVNVSGEREGQISPLLSVKVSRADWQRSSSVQQWAQYFGGSTTLLGFKRRSPNTEVASLAPSFQDAENEANFYDNR
jgi:hypothetical protein